MKAQCFMKQIKQIPQWMGKTIKKKEGKKKIKRKKKEERKEMLENQKLRAKQIEYIKQEEKWILQWNEAPIGNFIEPGTPKLTEGLREDTFQWEPVDVVPKKKIPFYKIQLIDGFGNIYGCNRLDYSRKALIDHIKIAHRGYIPSLNQIYQPPWIIWVVFYDDDTEFLFCQSNQDLT